jgi:hypothetical protein
MFRYLRIVILPLIAVTVMPVLHGSAEDIGEQLQAQRHAVPRLIRVQTTQDQECKKRCNSDFEACMVQVAIGREHGLSQATLMESTKICKEEHQACYRAC